MMTDTNIIIEVGKLDGRDIGYDESKQEFYIRDWDNKTLVYCCASTNYLTSRDAIIPVIEKLWYSNGFKPEDFYKALPQYIMTPLLALFITPRDLSIALLKATGKWEE